MACPLNDVVPSVNVIVYVVPILRAFVFIAATDNTSHEHDMDHSFRPVMNDLKSPFEGDATSMVSHPLDTLHDFKAAIFVPFKAI